MPIYKIINWKEYQHYKDRNPPWIKLHIELLTSPTWVMLDDAGRVLAVACMLLAGRNGTNGEFCGDPEYVQKVANLNQRPDFQKLINIGFLKEIKDDASIPLAGCYQSASNLHTNATRVEESRVEESRVEETIVSQKNPPPPSSAKADSLSVQINQIFDYWKKVMNHPKSHLDKKRTLAIRKALEKYSIDDLRQAIDGCAKTPHNMGQNDRGEIYDDIELIFRDASHIDRFMRNCLIIIPGNQHGTNQSNFNKNQFKPRTAGERTDAIRKLQDERIAAGLAKIKRLNEEIARNETGGSENKN